MTRWIKFLVVLAISATSCRETEAVGSVVLSPTVAPHTETPTHFSQPMSEPIGLDDAEDSEDSEDSSDEPDEDDASPSNAIVLRIGSTANTVDKIESTYRNWVGPTIGKPDRGDTACYREAHIMDTCPVDFTYMMQMCWAECPLSYPVKCGVECIRQSDDCGLEVFTKTASTLTAGLGLYKKGVFGDFESLAKGLQHGISCARWMLSQTRTILKYIRSLEVLDPQTPREQILMALYQTSYITIDLPVVIALCLKKDYPWEILDPVSLHLGVIQFLLAEIVAHQDQLIKSWDRFKAFLLGANFTEAVNELNETDISSLKSGMASNSSCGYELQRLTDRTWRAVAELKQENPEISQQEIRLSMSKSRLMTHDVSTVTNNCMEQMIAESDEATAYETRDKLRKTIGIMTNDLIRHGKSDNGTSIPAKEYARIVTDKIMSTISVLYLEPFRITSVLSEFIQPICGPTQFIGEIDDGTDPDTLGLKAVDDAFNHSSLSWTRVGDGAVIVKFESLDTEPVTVNIFSGGEKVAEVDVGVGRNMTWISNVKTLGGKTLYFDRWRPGFLGLPGTGGGSLKLWIPRAAEGGHLDLIVQLNVS